MERVCFALLVCLHAASLFVVPPVSVNVIATASCVIFIGASRSLKLLRVGEKRSGDGEVTMKKSEDAVTLSTRDAAQFPLVGSCALCGAYVMIKVFGRAFLNALLTIYFVGLGLFAVETALEGEVAKLDRVKRGAFKPEYLGVLNLRTRVGAWAAKAYGEDLLDLRLTLPQVGCYAVAAVVLGAYAATKYWMINNLIAACLCVSGLELISVGSFKNAAIMLCGLFVYDVWWVFGTEVMVTVAKGIDGPIKFLFVRSLDAVAEAAATAEAAARLNATAAALSAKHADPVPPGPSFSMLGLGDIVVPGLFIALLLRFDAQNAKAPADARPGDFAVPYFSAVMVAYAAGLAVTLYVMYAFDAAQPALLYLVPATLLTALGAGLCRKELAPLVAFSEEDDSEDAAAEAAAAPAAAATKED